MKLVEGKSILLEEYARDQIAAEEMHLADIRKMMRKPGSLSNSLPPRPGRVSRKPQRPLERCLCVVFISARRHAGGARSRQHRSVEPPTSTTGRGASVKPCAARNSRWPTDSRRSNHAAYARRARRPVPARAVRRGGEYTACTRTLNRCESVATAARCSGWRSAASLVGVKNFRARGNGAEACTAWRARAHRHEPHPTRMPRASSVADVAARAPPPDVLVEGGWDIHARRRGPAGYEQHGGPLSAHAPQLRPVAPLVFDARNRERIEALPPQLDDHAVGMWLGLGDDPGVGHCDSAADVSSAPGARRGTALTVT